jgi:hypothetical protein
MLLFTLGHLDGYENPPAQLRCMFPAVKLTDDIRKCLLQKARDTFRDTEFQLLWNKLPYTPYTMIIFTYTYI